MTHNGSLDPRHVDLNTTMPWLCNDLQSVRTHKGFYDITWAFGSYAGWLYLAMFWLKSSMNSFAIVWISCLLYPMTWHWRCMNSFQALVKRRKEEVNLVLKKQDGLSKSGVGVKASLRRLFSSKCRSEPMTLGFCIMFVIILWMVVIACSVIHRRSWSQYPWQDCRIMFHKISVYVISISLKIISIILLRGYYI